MVSIDDDFARFLSNNNNIPKIKGDEKRFSLSILYIALFMQKYNMLSYNFKTNKDNFGFIAPLLNLKEHNLIKINGATIKLTNLGERMLTQFVKDNHDYHRTSSNN